MLLAVGLGVLFGVGKPFQEDEQTQQEQDAMWARVGVGGAGLLTVIVSWSGSS